MKTDYKTKWLSTLYRGFVVTVGLLLAGSMAMAGQPLNGTYTINSANATGGTNFKTFNDLKDSLAINGVSAAVTVNVATSSGPYAERVEFTEVTGASAKNTITINGNGEKVVNTASSSVFEFNGADYFTLNNLKIEAQGTGTGTRCVHLWKQADHNTVKGCELIISKYTGSSNSTGYVVLSNSKTGNSAALHGSHNTFDDNKMSNGGAASTVGPYYAVCDYRSTTYSGTTGNNVFTNNDVSNVYYYWFYMYYCNGFTVDNNDIHDNRSNATYAYVFYSYYSRTTTHKISFSGNELHELTPTNYLYNYTYRTTGTSALPFTMNDNQIHDNSCLYFYNYMGYYGQSMVLDGNEIYDNEVDYYLYNMMGYYSQGDTKITNNEVSDNSAGYYVYGFYTYNAQDVYLEGNSVHDNSADYGVYGFYVYYMNGEITNNTYYNNSGDQRNYGILGGYSTNLNIVHNTFVLNEDVQYYSYGMYLYMSNTISNMNVKNNIIAMTGEAGGSYYNYVLYTYVQNQLDMNIENNDFYVDNSSVNYYGNTATSSLAAFSSALNNTTNIDVDPKFTDLTNGNIIPTNPEIANYGQPGYAKLDYDNKTRTACGPDLGAYEFYVDHNVSNLVFTGTNECGGYSEEIKFDFNNGSSVDLTNARAYYSINGGTPVIEEIAKIDASSSVSYTFTTVPEFHEPGTNTIEVGLLCDDNATNNTLTTTIDITPAPHSFDLAEGTNYPGYFRAGTMNNPDVTVPGKEVEYTIENPAKYVNGSSDWTVVLNSFTNNGTMLSSTDGITLVAPATSTKGMLTIDPVSSLADSMIYLGLTVTDNITGCDSTFGRWMYVPHTPSVAWEGSNGCDGDLISIVNGTKQEIGAVEYTWDFDDPNSGVEDNTSTISDPVHRFSTYGTYDIKMTAWNFDYPKFLYTLTKQLTILPVPTVNFKVDNACEGQNIQFNNNTTLPSGITGTIDYTWNFGDNSATSILKDPTHQYANPGGYQVSLSASLQGCVAKIVKNANQFATPVADFSVAGNCNLEEIEFMNSSTIALGNTGYKWDFKDGSVSNLSNPMHAFDMPGSHTVKLIAVSEFGCTDNIEKSFTLNESPKADFNFTDACSETAVDFTRGGSLPSGANSIFEWDFDGEKISTKENDSHLFSTVGVKKVALKVSSDNGCSDMIVKEFVVKLQAKADFIASDVCEGDDVVFTNKSEVAAGNLNYSWRFGDADLSDLTSPRHGYALATAGVTESFQVTLLALVPGGCSDSIAKTVTVNAKSDASFTATSKWRTITLNQVTKDPTFIHNWRFGEGGRSNNVDPSYKYSIDNGTFEVCLAIINGAGCISEECKEVIITTGLNDIASEEIFSVYPNPNAGVFNVKVNSPENNLNIVIMDATGKTIKTVNADASGLYSVDISDVAAGVYMVQVVNGNFSAMQRVTVAN